jgi:hypothetical protein
MPDAARSESRRVCYLPGQRNSGLDVPLFECGEASASSVGSCRGVTASNTACSDFFMADRLADERAWCEYWHFAWSDEACPSDGVVARCDEPLRNMVTSVYAAGGVANLESYCEDAIGIFKAY